MSASGSRAQERGGEQDEGARERKEEAKLRGKEIGRARALRCQKERELMEQRRERELEEKERQKERGQARWRDFRQGRGRESERNGDVQRSKKQWRRSLRPSDKEPDPEGGGRGSPHLGDTSRESGHANMRDDPHNQDDQSRKGTERRRRTSASKHDNSAAGRDRGGAMGTGRRGSWPEGERKSTRRREKSRRPGVTGREMKPARALEGLGGIGSVDSGTQRAWVSYSLSLPAPSMHQHPPRFHPGTAVAFITPPRRLAMNAVRHPGPFLREMSVPHAQGSGTLSSSSVRGMGSGTLAVAVTPGGRPAPYGGVGTLAVW